MIIRSDTSDNTKAQCLLFRMILTVFFLGDFHRYLKLCQCTAFHVGTGGKKAKTLSWGFWLKPIQRVFDLDPDVSRGLSILPRSFPRVKSGHFQFHMVNRYL